MTWLAVVVIAQAPAEAAGAGAVPDNLRVGSVWDLLVKGGPVMIPIVLCSLIAVAIVAERLIALRRSRLIPPEFVPGLKRVLRDPRRDRRAAAAYCEKDPSPIAAVFAVGIKRLGEPLDLLERHVSEAGERQVHRLRVRLRLLSVLATLAPLLGLLGTITGMISAFQTVAVSGEALGKTEMLAKGIYEAMITTAAGLIVAIPLTLCYHWISSIIEKRVAEIDRLVSEFVEHYALNGGREGAGAGEAAEGAEGAPAPVEAAAGNGEAAALEPAGAGA